ncbi:MAG: hypothetical protein ABW002_18790 [Xanthomonas sp.]
MDSGIDERPGHDAAVAQAHAALQCGSAARAIPASARRERRKALPRLHRTRLYAAATGRLPLARQAS